VWHIATHVYLELHRREAGATSAVPKAAMAVANYMFFLLAARPYMLPYPVSRQAYLQLFHDAVTPLRYCNVGDLLNAILNQKEALLKGAPLQPDKGIGRRQGNRGEDSMNNTTLDRGCQLAAKLIHITAGKREESMVQASSSRRKKHREQRDFCLVQTKEDIMKQAEGTINGEVVLNMVLEVWAEIHGLLVQRELSCQTPSRRW